MNPEIADKINQQVRLSIGDLHIQIVSLQLALTEARAENERLQKQIAPTPKKISKNKSAPMKTEIDTA